MFEIQQIVKFFEEFAPRKLAEDWDNVGLLIGDYNQKVNKILLTLDINQDTFIEAKKINANLIISHHPLIFKDIKRLTNTNIKEKLIIDLIKNNIACYCAHTNLDACDEGVNKYLAQKIGLTNIKNYKTTYEEKLYKIVIFVPSTHLEILRNSLSEIGCGWIGNYSDCSFATEGIGTFKPLAGTKPFIGQTDKLEKTEEVRLETIAYENLLKIAIEIIKKVHPYEEVAYDIYPLAIKGKEYGFGKCGQLEEEVSLKELSELVKIKLNITNLKVVGNLDKKIKKIAVFSGSFDGDIKSLSKENIDVIVTGDLKYHTALDLIDMDICAIDAGHFGTEIIILENLKKELQDKFKGLECFITESQKDPFITI